MGTGAEAEGVLAGAGPLALTLLIHRGNALNGWARLATGAEAAGAEAREVQGEAGSETEAAHIAAPSPSLPRRKSKMGAGPEAEEAGTVE